MDCMPIMQQLCGLFEIIILCAFVCVHATIIRSGEELNILLKMSNIKLDFTVDLAGLTKTRAWPLMDFYPHICAYLYTSKVDKCSAAEGTHGRVLTSALFNFIFVMQRWTNAFVNLMAWTINPSLDVQIHWLQAPKWLIAATEVIQPLLTECNTQSLVCLSVF